MHSFFRSSRSLAILPPSPSPVLVAIRHTGVHPPSRDALTDPSGYRLGRGSTIGQTATRGLEKPDGNVRQRTTSSQQGQGRTVAGEPFSEEKADDLDRVPGKCYTTRIESPTAVESEARFLVRTPIPAAGARLA